MNATAIRLLPPTTANRIAAGEVVERPAAALKELVENALDAGATRIVVTLEAGGIDRLVVEDDGHGMDAADLALCVERHATSKLAEEALLFRIATLGFRGEALPSIGAVARLSITSRPAGAAGAHRIEVVSGTKGAVAPASGPAGTRVEIRDLFAAVPARRAFLRTPRAEAEAALDALRRLALAWPAVGFRAESDGRAVLALAADTPAGRIRDVLGAEFAAAALPVAAQAGDLALSGLAAQPGYSRANGLAQHLVVNRRPVRDTLLRTALRVAYRDVLAAGRFPAAALFLDLPADAVDVNVHPMKTELRFRDEAAVRSLLIGGLRRALGVGAAAAPLGFGPLPAGGAGPWRSGGAGPWRSGGAGAWRTGSAGWPPVAGAANGTAAPFGLAEAMAPAPLPPALALGFAPPRPAPPTDAALDAAFPLGRPLGQLLDTYIVAEAADGALVLVDQHAAHERLTQEALHAERIAGGVRAQKLLLPAVVELPPAEAARIVAAGDELAALGLEVEAFGAGAVLVRALPALLGAPDPAPLLRDVADALAAAEGPAALTARLDAAIARLACHGSIRAGRRLEGAAMAALLRALEATPRAATCSHGRPTVLRLDAAALARLFGRR